MKYYCLLLIVLFSLSSFAQKSTAISVLKKEGVIAALEFVENSGISAYSYGLELAKESHDDSLLWFESLYSNQEKSQFVIGKAWVHWLRGDFQESMRLTSEVIQKETDILNLARAHHVQSLVLIATDIVSAEDHAKKSLKYFQQYGMTDLFPTHSLLAEIAIAARNFDEAEKHMALALVCARNSNARYNLGRLNELRSEQCWIKNQLADALSFAQKSMHEYFQAGRHREAWTLKARVGILAAESHKDWAIDGPNKQLAKMYALELDSYSQGVKDPKIRAIALILCIQVARCERTDFSLLLAELKSWKGFEDSGFNELLNYILRK